jgi:ribonucleoside-diphosphate reductase alpha chain
MSVTMAGSSLSENSIKVLGKTLLCAAIMTARCWRRRQACFIVLPITLPRWKRDHGGDVAAAEDTFYACSTELRFFPNSPTFTGAGTPLGQLAACFVLPIADDMGKDGATASSAPCATPR